MNTRHTPVKVCGTLIRHKRLAYKLTQAQLAKNICSQGTVSQVENHNISPNLEIILSICQRLDISITTVLSNNRSIKTLSHVEKAILINDYQQATDLIDKINVYQLDCSEDKIRFYCYKGLLELHWHRDFNRAMTYFSTANNFSAKRKSFYFIWVGIGMSLVYYKNGFKAEALELINQVRVDLEQVDHHLISPSLLSRIYYDLIVVYSQYDHHELILQMGNKIKNHLIDHQPVRMFAFIMLFMGRSHQFKEEFEQSQAALHCAKILSKVCADDELTKLVDDELRIE